MGLRDRRTAAVQSVEHGTALRAARDEADRLRRELARAQGVLDALPVGIVLVERGGLVRTRNAAAQGLGGSTSGDVLVLEAVDRHAHHALLGRSTESDVELFGPPRRVIHVRAVPTPDGGALVVLEDVSERARLDAVRTDFVANISHELKTPVGAMAVLAEAMTEEDDPETLSRLAEKVVLEAHRAVTSIDDLMELSRIELGGLAHRDPVDMIDVVRDAMDRTAESAVQRRICVRVGKFDQPGRVSGDRRQLVSAVANLIDNAVKYSESGTDVCVDVVEDAGSVTVVVRDHGIGIPTRDLDRIFERFYRVDRARSRATGGTGLGLAIVRHVANNHEGEVSVQSTEGEGSTFTIRIPAVTA